MNIDDQATQQEEYARAIALKMRKFELPKTGFCYNCSDPVKEIANFCDQHCRQDFERRQINQKGK
jgi:predicted amidophosphoribosyltransferase